MKKSRPRTRERANFRTKKGPNWGRTKKGLQIVTENFATFFFTRRKEICHLELTLASEKKEKTPPPWHPSFLGLPPGPEVTGQKKLWCTPFSWETREKGIHHRSEKNEKNTIEAADSEKEKKEGLHGGGGIHFSSLLREDSRVKDSYIMIP